MFIDLKNAFKLVDHRRVFEFLKRYGIDDECLNLIKNLYLKHIATMKRAAHETMMRIYGVVHQGACSIIGSFNTCSEEALSGLEKSIRITIAAVQPNHKVCR